MLSSGRPGAAVSWIGRDVAQLDQNDRPVGCSSRLHPSFVAENHIQGNGIHRAFLRRAVGLAELRVEMVEGLQLDRRYPAAISSSMAMKSLSLPVQLKVATLRLKARLVIVRMRSAARNCCKMALPGPSAAVSAVILSSAVTAAGRRLARRGSTCPALSLAMYQLKFWVAGWPMFKEVGLQAVAQFQACHQRVQLVAGQDAVIAMALAGLQFAPVVVFLGGVGAGQDDRILHGGLGILRLAQIGAACWWFSMPGISRNRGQKAQRTRKH